VPQLHGCWSLVHRPPGPPDQVVVSTVDQTGPGCAGAMCRVHPARTRILTRRS
jgi:hypothetical protein